MGKEATEEANTSKESNSIVDTLYKHEGDDLRADELEPEDTMICDDDEASSFTSNSTSMHRSDSSSSSFIDFSKFLGVPDFDWNFEFEQMGGTTRKRFTNMKKKTKERLEKLKTEAKIGDKDLDELNEIFVTNLTKLDKRLNSKLQSTATEKLFYAISVFSIAAIGFIIGKYPEWFHIFHTVLFCVLMPVRFYTYFKKSFQYYLADLCYYVNLLLMLFIWKFPDSKSLFVSVFALSMGTLSFAVITWRNSLVLHLIEKTTSSFIHIMPPVTLFVLVHEYPRDDLIKRFPAVAEISNWNFVNGIVWTSIYYTLWQVTYLYFIIILQRDKIKQGRVTSFTYLKKKKKDKGLGKFVNSLPYLWMQIAAYVLIQFGYQILTMVFCPIWFHYKHACGAFMVFIFVWAAYNGATYYIDVFGKRLEKEVERLKSELVELQESNQVIEDDSSDKSKPTEA